MKKLLLLTTILLLTACQFSESKELKKYRELIDILNNRITSFTCDDLEVKVEVEYLTNNIYNYRALINKPDYPINEVEALLISSEKEDIYPSIGIFDNKVSLNEETKEKGIKLSGYTYKKDSKYRLYLSYKSDNKTYKCYYIIDNPTYIE